MIREDIIRMARTAGIRIVDIDSNTASRPTTLERFAELIAATEREACAELCEHKASVNAHDPIAASRMRDCADAIRKRGEQ